MNEKSEKGREREFRKISEAELAEILERHKRWLESKGKDGEKADLRDTEFEGADLQGAALRRANLLHAGLAGANFQGADLTEADLVGARLNGANLAGADLARANLDGANLKGANLGDADLEGASFRGSDLTEADLAGAELNGANMERADLRGANLEGAGLYGADLREANLWGADLWKANLEGANLAGAGLREANLEGANLRVANFEGVNLSGVSYSRSGRYRGIRLATCYGSVRFKRFAQDQDFIEELKGSGRWGKMVWFFWLILADCGRSFSLWAGWCVSFSFAFALLFTTPGELPHWIPEWFRDFSQWVGALFEQKAMNYRNIPLGFWSALYLSVVSFTTLGFGDIVAASPSARFLVTLEVILGYIMLGGLISILATKLARRS